MDKEKQPYIILYKYDKSMKMPWYSHLVCKAITFFTGAPYIHAGIYLNGYLYESTMVFFSDRVFSGTRKTKVNLEALWNNKYIDILGFKNKLSEEIVEALEIYLNASVKFKRPYNIFKLIALALVYPTRHFWRAIHYIPFDRELLGAVCSEYVDESFKAIGIDLLPNELEGYTAPRDFLRSKLLQVENH